MIDSQKLMEDGEINDEICSLASLDIPLEEYLTIDFEMKYYRNSIIENNEV